MKVVGSQPTHTYATKYRTSIDLRLAENPLGPSPLAIEAIIASSKNSHSYPTVEKDLISSIALHHDVPEESVIIGAGANQLLEKFLRILANGKNIVVPTATFPEAIVGRPQTEGTSVTRVPLNNNFSLNLDEMLKCCREDTALIHLCNPNNPTGIWTDLREIEDFANQTSLPVLISEAGADFIGQTSITNPEDSNLIIVRSFSKGHGLAGLRVGYAIASPEIIFKVRNLARSFQVSSLSIVAAQAALNDTEHLRNTLEFVFREKAWLSDELVKLDFKPIHSQGQTFIVRVPEKFKGATDFCEQAKEYDISVVDCSLYQGLEQFIRINPQLHSINEKFIRCLKVMMEK